MTSSKRWALAFALVAGAVGIALLLSLKPKVVAGSSGPKRSNVPTLGQGQTAASPLSGGFASTGTYTCATYLPLTSMNAGAPPPLFGVQMYGAVTYTTGLTEAAAAGVRWIRAPIAWASAEPADCTPDQYNWAAIDAQVRALTDEGIEPLVTLGGNPPWAATYPMGPVTDVADLQEFVGALVERFDGDGYEDAPGSPVVRYWEMYNEPDNTDEWHAAHGGYGYWGNEGRVYAAMLDAIYPIVKAASPKAQVVFGGVAHDHFVYEGGIFDPDFIDDVLSNCAGPCFDVMNFHYFPFYRSRWEAYGRDVIGKTRYLRFKLANYSFDRPLMCTEIGWPSATVWGSEALQSRYVAAAYARGMAAGLVLQNWFALRDIDSSLPGLLDSHLQPRPAYYAFQTLTAQLGQARYVRPLTGDETGGGNIEGYVFDTPGADRWERLDVVWCDCPEYQHTPPADCPPGTSQTMAFPVSAIRIVDLYGNETVRVDADDGVIDGRVVLEVRPDPVYVKRNLPPDGSDLNKGPTLRAPDGGLRENGISQGDGYTYPNCRFGVGAGANINQYDVAALNLGWYVDWQSTQSPQPPAGLEYVQTIRLEQVGLDGWTMVSPAPGQLTATVQANPGAMWLFGNEPDSPFQDDMVPEAYAHAYHDVYFLIKGLDPTALVAIGGIVQPTPLRFAYLDAVWDAYRQAYEETMPVDVWNIHTFILRETTDAPDPEPCGPNTIPVWGAYIPPGSSAQAGELYCIRDQDNIESFEQRIREFRQWMADKGERNKPLIVTEYGVLFPEDYYDEDGEQLSAERVGAFMQSTFDFFRSHTDPSIGYPADGNRLVQRWAWFSVDGDPWRWGGTLFDPNTHALRPLGEDFRAYTNALTPTVDLIAVRAFAEPAAIPYEGTPATATLKALISNAGDVATTGTITVTFYDGPLGQGDVSAIGEPQVITHGLQGCGNYAVVSVIWEGLEAGGHPFSVQVQASDGEDSDPTNNAAEEIALVATERLWLPLVLRTW
jgi:hypothetical protein